MTRTLLAAGAAMTLALSLSTFAQADSPREFLHKATAGDSSEIMLGHLAERGAGNPHVKEFGHTLVKDHTKARQQAARVAYRMGIRPSYSPMPKAVLERDKLRRMGQRAFDREFVRYMIHDHRKDISDFRDEAREHHGPVSALAEKQLPVLQKHLDIALSLRDRETRLSYR